MSRAGAAALFGRLGGFAADQFVEVALLAGGGFLFDNQGQPALVELLEPFVPANRLQFLIGTPTGEIEADHADIVGPAGAPHASGLGAAIFGPRADLFGIGQDARYALASGGHGWRARPARALRLRLGWRSLSRLSGHAFGSRLFRLLRAGTRYFFKQALADLGQLLIGLDFLAESLLDHVGGLFVAHLAHHLAQA